MMRNRERLALLAASASLAIAGSSLPSAALEDGDTVRIIVSFSPGGGFDTNARLLAPYLETALQEAGFPGTSVVVENMPGGAGTIGTTTVFTSDPDGTTLGILEPADGTWQELLLGTEFKVGEFSYLGQQSTETYGLVLRAGFEAMDFDSLVARSQETPILLGTPGRSSYSGRIFPVLMQQSLADAGIDLRFDYLNLAGTGDVMASMRRGEAEGFLSGVNPITKFVEEGHAEFLYSFGDDPWPDAQEVMGLTDAQYAPLADAAMSRRVYIAPPGVDPELLGTLRTAFEAALTDPAFQAQAAEAGFPVTFLDGEATQAAVASMGDLAIKYQDVVQKSLDASQ